MTARLRRITYSPKVFIPLTMLCRDRCGYCTFAQSPAHLPSAYLSIDEVLAHRPGRAPRRAAMRRCSRSASSPRTGTPWHGEWLDGARLRLDRRLRRARRPAGAGRDGPAAARERRRPGPRGPRHAASGRAEPGDDDRVAQPRPRRRTAARRTRTPSAGWRPCAGPASWRSRSPRASSWASASRGPTASSRWRPSPRRTGDFGHVQEVIVQNFVPEAGHPHARPPGLLDRRPARDDRAGAGRSCPPRCTCRRRRTSSTTRARCSTPASTTSAASRPSRPTTSTPSGPGRTSTTSGPSWRRAGWPSPRA